MKISSQILSKHTVLAESILNSGNDNALLKLYRNESTLIVLMVRVRNEERKEAYASRQAEIENDYEALDKLPEAFEQIYQESLAKETEQE